MKTHAVLNWWKLRYINILNHVSSVAPFAVLGKFYGSGDPKFRANFSSEFA